MNGTRSSDTLVMDLMPPMMTSATRAARAIAMIQEGTPKFVVKLAATALACTMQPMPNAQTDASTAKIIPSHLM